MQHAAQILAGIEHLLKQRLALAQRGIRVDTAAAAQQQRSQY